MSFVQRNGVLLPGNALWACCVSSFCRGFFHQYYWLWFPYVGGWIHASHEYSCVIYWCLQRCPQTAMARDVVLALRNRSGMSLAFIPLCQHISLCVKHANPDEKNLRIYWWSDGNDVGQKHGFSVKCRQEYSFEDVTGRFSLKMRNEWAMQQLSRFSIFSRFEKNVNCFEKYGSVSNFRWKPQDILKPTDRKI